MGSRDKGSKGGPEVEEKSAPKGDGSHRPPTQESTRKPSSEIRDPTASLSTLSLSSAPTGLNKLGTGGSTAPRKQTAKPMPNPFAANSTYTPLTKPTVGKVQANTQSPMAKRVGAVTIVPDEQLGKYANSATTEADDGDDILPEQLQGPIRASPIRSGIHRKPRFKQVIPKLPSEEFKKSDLKSLLDFATAEHENDEEEDKGDLKIDGLLPRLLPHQCRGVRFMARREQGRKYARGGLLADEMGLGKTIQSIAIILYRPPESQEAPKTTLVITPLAVMDQWKDEISKMAPKLKVGTHHGPKRTKSAQDFMEYDVLVTTYDVVVRDHPVTGPLYSHEWHRIIADEAHTFREPKTKLAAAMAGLKSNGRRWALTGTPLHNKISDLFPLFRFIGVPKSETLEEFEETYGGKDTSLLKKQLRAIMLRRTQKILGSYLPPIVMHPTEVAMTKRELRTYYSWAFDANKSSAYVRLTRMRQACDGLLGASGIDPWGVDDKEEVVAEKPKARSEAAEPEDSGKYLQSNSIEEADDLAAMLGMLSIKPKTDGKETFNGDQNSKVQAVRRILVQERTRKTVVFSSFVTMLHALRPMLEFEGIKYLLYDGSLNVSKRRELLDKFRDEKAGYIVLLCSLQTAAVGLNLTSASQVVMVEPWWNPQIVDQAIKRVHRLGQKREVDCYELFAGNLLDERIVRIQERKRKLAKQLIDGDMKLSRDEKDYLMYGDEVPEGESFEIIKKPANEPFETVDLPWATQRKLPKVPKHPGKEGAKADGKASTAAVPGKR